MFFTSVMNCLHLDFTYILAIGSILFLLLHAILFSKMGDMNGIMTKYRSYIYWLLVIDLGIAFYISRMQKTCVVKKHKKKEDSSDDTKKNSEIFIKSDHKSNHKSDNKNTKTEKTKVSDTTLPIIASNKKD